MIRALCLNSWWRGYCDLVFLLKQIKNLRQHLFRQLRVHQKTRVGLRSHLTEDASDAVFGRKNIDVILSRHTLCFAGRRSHFRASGARSFTDRFRGVTPAALVGLRRFVVTSRTARHRTFQFLDASFLPETKVLIFAFDDAFHLGVLSSRIHVLFANRVGGWLGVGNDSTYNHSDCLEKFPFSTATVAQQTRIRDLGERLDAHRKRQQAQHPKLTFTDLYNVLEKLRGRDGSPSRPGALGESALPLNAKEQLTHEHGLVTVLRQLHDDLDTAVAEAYALPPTATDDTILTHLCALNAQRAAEERTGQIRWLRPAFQNPTSTATQTSLATGEAETTPATAKPAGKLAWPKTLAEQAQAVRAALAAPTDAATLAKTFTGAKTDRVEDILETLASLGQARQLADGRFVSA